LHGKIKFRVIDAHRINLWIFPTEKNLIKTNEEDPIDYYYYPIIGYFYRRRLRDVLSLLDRGEAGAFWTLVLVPASPLKNYSSAQKISAAWKFIGASGMSSQ